MLLSPILGEPQLLTLAKVTQGWFHRHRCQTCSMSVHLMDRLHRLQVARCGEAVEWGAGVKGGKSSRLHLLRQFSQQPRRQHQFMLRLTLPLGHLSNSRRRHQLQFIYMLLAALQRRHSRHPKKSRQRGQLLGAPEAAVSEAVEWGKVVKVVVHLVVAVRRRLQRRHSRQPQKSWQGGQLLRAPEVAVREAVEWGASMAALGCCGLGLGAEAELQAAARRLLAGGLTGQLLRLAAAELGSSAWEKADKIAPILELPSTGEGARAPGQM